mmetsp:Transcript_26502/g.66412  ORF Transcript_26502/g.66412 Transcript_26502/m.66412 type:complete len:312 (+) Transcript_26502:2090-3025(+)
MSWPDPSPSSHASSKPVFTWLPCSFFAFFFRTDRSCDLRTDVSSLWWVAGNSSSIFSRPHFFKNRSKMIFTFSFKSFLESLDRKIRDGSNAGMMRSSRLGSRDTHATFTAPNAARETSRLSWRSKMPTIPISTVSSASVIPTEVVPHRDEIPYSMSTSVRRAALMSASPRYSNKSRERQYRVDAIMKEVVPARPAPTSAKNFRSPASSLPLDGITFRYFLERARIVATDKLRFFEELSRVEMISSGMKSAVVLISTASVLSFSMMDLTHTRRVDFALFESASSLVDSASNTLSCEINPDETRNEMALYPFF